eukprot:1697628-Amphidinium_carterae.1
MAIQEGVGNEAAKALPKTMLNSEVLVARLPGCTTLCCQMLVTFLGWPTSANKDAWLALTKSEGHHTTGVLPSFCSHKVGIQQQLVPGIGDHPVDGQVSQLQVLLKHRNEVHSGVATPRGPR